ncbi:MAG: two-component system, OmpR family, sensor histidine kinase KdpD [Frankiales bacterium]|nr:two-component system, OmpR family, sensor histidine kinase KdpD [Frankiales bacterium]
MSRGVLRVYLGAAPGVGKTYAMLDEGHRRADRGTDVVIGYIETHGRPHTAAKVDGLEQVPRRTLQHRGASFTELDLDAVLRRAPDVALIDELAHTNVPGTTHGKRWQDVEALLEAGIDVISTVNVQHLDSLNDVVEQITGVPQRETVPDSVVRAADQVELVDMTPEALRRRMAHGNIYAPEKVDAALGNYFRVGNLTALRELALLWLADSVEEGLQRYRAQHGIADTWETRERVVVALTGGLEGDTLIRRAARIAARAAGGDLLAVHVARSDGLSGASPATLTSQRLLVESLGGSYHSLVGDNVSAALLEFARANNATQIVIGASRRRRYLVGPGTGATTVRNSGPIDVHVVSHDYAGKGRSLPALTSGLNRRRRLFGALTATVLLTGLTLLGTATRHDLTIGTDLLLYLLAVVVVCLVGGFWPALAAAVVASLLLNYYFVPPVHTFTISEPENALSLAVFVLIAVLVSRVVDLAASRSSQAARSSAEAETLSTLAGSLLRGETALPALLERVRETFAVTNVTLLRRDTTAPASSGAAARGRWSVVATTGSSPCTQPETADTEVPLGDDLTLALTGRSLPPEDRRVLSAFAAQAAVAYQQRQLMQAAQAAAPLAEADRMRTALLNAVSHDLRTPLAVAKAAISGLADAHVTWSADDRDELLSSAGAALDRLTELVTNLLDLSRLQAGVLSVFPRAVALDDIVSQALAHVAADSHLDLHVPPDLPEVLADPGLLERVIANLVQNAVRHSPPNVAVRVAGSSHGGVVELRVIDRGPGIPQVGQSRAFEPFQRLHDHASSDDAGVGLGLAIARGFTEAMSGVLTMEDTPGGGLTMVVQVPTAQPDESSPV